MIISCALLALGLDAWSLTWQTASGQTVPRTPPPTFTRTFTPTPRVTPTHTPLPTATYTLVPGAPTPVPRPDLFIALAAKPGIAGPGNLVTFTCQVGNRGNAPANNLTASLSIPWPLAIQDVSLPKGQFRFDANEATISLDSLQPGEEIAITLRARVQENASPGKTLRYRAQLTSTGGERESNEVIIELPWALLPATGG